MVALAGAPLGLLGERFREQPRVGLGRAGRGREGVRPRGGKGPHADPGRGRGGEGSDGSVFLVSIFLAINLFS